MKVLKVTSPAVLASRLGKKLKYNMKNKTEARCYLLSDKLPSPILDHLNFLPSQQSVESIECGLDSSVNMGAFRQTIAAISGCLCTFITGCWLSWPSASLKNLLTGNARLSLDANQASWVVALLDVGNMVSPLLVAYFADKFGRKTTMLSTGPLFLVCSLLTFPTGSPYYLYLARFLSGFCKGISFTVVPMYLGEIASASIRGALTTLMTGALWSGTLTMFIVGPHISYDTLNTLLGVLPIVFILTFIWMPESPYSLLMRKEEHKAKTSLLWLRNESEQTDKELKAMKDNLDEDMKSKGSYWELLTVYSNRKAIIIVLLMCVFQRLSGISSLLAYSSTTLPQSSGLLFLGQNEIIVLFGLLLTIANFSATPLVDIVGRKPLHLLSCIGTSICCAVSGIYYLAVPTLDRLGWVPYLALLAFGLFQAIGLTLIPITLLSELFPANVKAKAAAISTIVLALSSFLTDKIYLPVKADYGVQYMFFFFSFTCLVGFLFSLFFVFETKGKTFPEIQEMLKRK